MTIKQWQEKNNYRLIDTELNMLAMAIRFADVEQAPVADENSLPFFKVDFALECLTKFKAQFDKLEPGRVKPATFITIANIFKKLSK